MNILSTSVTKTTIFPEDDIPIWKLATQHYIRSLAQVFAFQDININQPNPNQILLDLRNGLYNGGSDDRAVNRLQIARRKIVFTLRGTSEDAAGFFEELRAYLEDLSDIDRPLRTLLEAEESEVTAALDFSIEDLYSPRYWSFVQSVVQPQLSSDIAAVTVRPVQLRFRVDYMLEDKSIQEQGIGLASKEFILEPRLNTLLSDQVFFSKAPLDTAAHLALLAELERQLA